MFIYGRLFYLTDVFPIIPNGYFGLLSAQVSLYIFPLLSFISAQFQNFVAFYSQYLLLARVGAVESYEIEIVIVFNQLLSRSMTILNVNNARLQY